MLDTGGRSSHQRVSEAGLGHPSPFCSLRSTPRAALFEHSGAGRVPARQVCFFGLHVAARNELLSISALGRVLRAFLLICRAFPIVQTLIVPFLVCTPLQQLLRCGRGLGRWASRRAFDSFLLCHHAPSHRHASPAPIAPSPGLFPPLLPPVRLRPPVPMDPLNVRRNELRDRGPCRAPRTWLAVRRLVVPVRLPLTSPRRRERELTFLHHQRGPAVRAAQPNSSVVSLLPAGGELTLQIACNKEWTTFGGRPTDNVACPGNNGELARSE